jgi:hypothetical protein
MAKKAGGASGKLTYYFGTTGATAEATRSSSLGGKGANLAEMTNDRPAGASGLHDHHGHAAPSYYDNGQQSAEGPDGRGAEERSRSLEKETRARSSAT